MKIKKMKLAIFITILLLIFIVFLYFIFRAYNYEKNYVIDKFKITEIYQKEDSSYIFYLDSNNISYPYVVKTKYIRKKELIKDIEIYESKEEKCIIPKSDYIEFYPLCSKDENIYTYNLSSIKDISYSYEKIEKIDKNYKDIQINKTNGLTFLIYNYKGFYLINDDTYENIKLFEKDNYSLDLIYQKDNYLIVPNYNQDYYFNKLYLINILNGKVKEIEVDIDISYESVFIGNYKNNVYLLDKKEEKEYKIDINKRKIEQVDYQIIKDDKLVKVDYKEIVNSLDKKEENLFEYKIINNNLYHIINEIKIKISNKEVDKIIKYDNNTIYYLCNEDLYMYNDKNGEVLLLSNFEWNFNNTNVIYLYK